MTRVALCSCCFDFWAGELPADPEKNVAFATCSNALGVVFDLSGLVDGFFTVGNTERRKRELAERIDAVLAGESLRPWEAKSLRSRLLFAEAQIFGRTAKLDLSELGKIEESLEWQDVLSPSLEHSLKWLKKHVAETPPRRVEVRDKQTFLLFLDGACEGGDGQQASIGGVLCDRQVEALLASERMCRQMSWLHGDNVTSSS